jgi:hypothetical protein
MDTYGLSSAAEQTRVIITITPNDLQRVATRLFRDAAIASVAVGNSELVKTSVERYGKIELIGEVVSNSQATPNQNSGNPQTKTPAKPE